MELITVTFGKTAQFLNTHYWNIEQHSILSDNLNTEIDPHILFDEHRQPASSVFEDSLTSYTPRALHLDLASNVGPTPWSEAQLKDKPEGKGVIGQPQQLSSFHDYISNPQSADHRRRYAEAASQILPFWDTQRRQGRDITHFDDIRPSFHIKQDRYATDYSEYDPPTAVQIHGLGTRDNPTPNMARDLDATIWEDMEDNLRHYMERCDTPSGLQMVTGAEWGWAPPVVRMIEWASEEMSKKPMLIFDLADEANNTQRGNLLANLEGNAALIPISLETTAADIAADHTLYQRTAMPAVLLHSLTAGVRREGYSLDGLVRGLVPTPRQKLCSAYYGFNPASPATVERGDDAQLVQHDASKLRPDLLSPHDPRSMFAWVGTIHRIPVRRSLRQEWKGAPGVALGSYMDRKSKCKRRLATAATTIPLPVTFPHFWTGQHLKFRTSTSFVSEVRNSPYVRKWLSRVSDTMRGDEKERLCEMYEAYEPFSGGTCQMMEGEPSEEESW
eukprot:gnl/Dysnectes_brevis/5029_a7045_548.p1 GENE.gnl/Dysnectes_brevis/5029_a7045_548~~gnl/Dysnectes_brevis/5029_a7045_548.p1  ORF type:complete len:502 (-),score=94.22 gnl/Dysnectes_brevis/5029_a7045_548:42-1547(-)